MKKLFILTIVLLFCGFIQAQATSEKDIADWNIALFERPYPDDWKKALTPESVTLSHLKVNIRAQ